MWPVRGLQGWGGTGVLSSNLGLLKEQSQAVYSVPLSGNQMDSTK